MVGNSNSNIALRLIEAAETERRLSAAGIRPAGCKGIWPEAKYSFVDICLRLECNRTTSCPM